MKEPIKCTVALMVAALCLLTVGCGRFANGSDESDSGLTETGYPSGQVQRALVYYNGYVYGYDFYDYLQDGQILTDTLPDGYTYAGSTEGEDPTRIPNEEFTTAQMSDGCEIYASVETTTVIYVKYPSETSYRQFVDVSEWVKTQYEQ